MGFGSSTGLGFGGYASSRQGGRAPQHAPDDNESIADPAVRPGSSNVSGGLVRRKKRGIKGLSGANVSGVVDKNYRTTDAVMFNNLNELFQDTISREFAQEIIEDFFEKSGINIRDATVAKYAEDALFSFFIATTASNKADYNRQIPIPNKTGGENELDFQVLSNMLSSEYGITRRNFSCGIADDQRRFLQRPENTHLLPVLATRVGCDPQFATLAFDGSTHCTGLTSREVGFTKTLKVRNLFESDEMLAPGASDKLLQGMPAGVRSVVPR